MKQVILIALILSLSACARPSQNVYDESDMGREYVMHYGRIIAIRTVEIQPANTKTGASVGALAGGAAASPIGNDEGNAVAIVGGALIGAAIGALAEEHISRREGLEYTVDQDNGKVVTIVQSPAKDDAPLTVGQRVMVQFHKDANYRRVLPAVEREKPVKKAKIKG